MKNLVVKAAQVVATGLAGAVAYDGVKRIARSGVIRGDVVPGDEVIIHEHVALPVDGVVADGGPGYWLSRR